jgi:hypothetical protein
MTRGHLKLLHQIKSNRRLEVANVRTVRTVATDYKKAIDEQKGKKNIIVQV